MRTAADHSLASIAIAQGVGQEQIALLSLAGVKQEYCALFTRAESRFESRHFEEDTISEVCFLTTTSRFRVPGHTRYRRESQIAYVPVA